MIQALDIQFLEISIRTWLSRMDNIFHMLREEDLDLSEYEFSHKEIAGEYKREFETLSDRVYNSCLIYFELKGIPLYIENFKNEFQKLIVDGLGDRQLADYDGTDIYYNDHSIVTKFYRENLFPFRAFGSGDSAHLTGLDYLEKILNSTNRILSDRNIKPTQESEVYSSVRIVVEATFSDTQASFPGGTKVINQMAQGYIPDILIPDLQCAIEYKFADSEKDLNTKIDQVLADVKGYDNHAIYNLFYAVFYVKTGAITKDRFDLLWQSKSFPSNWKPVFVEGPTYSKPKKGGTKPTTN